VIDDEDEASAPAGRVTRHIHVKRELLINGDNGAKLCHGAPRPRSVVAFVRDIDKNRRVSCDGPADGEGAIKQWRGLAEEGIAPRQIIRAKVLLRSAGVVACLGSVALSL